MTPRRPRPTGSSLRLLRRWRSLLGFLPYFIYYCSDNARSALETGNRPAGHFREPPFHSNGQVVPRWSAGGAISAQGGTAVTPIFRQWHLACHVFPPPFSAARGSRYAEVPCSRTCLSFPPTGSLFLVYFPFPPSRGGVSWRHGADAPRARACGSFAGGALFWAFYHILYTTSVTTRAARWKKAGRPLQETRNSRIATHS